MSVEYDYGWPEDAVTAAENVLATYVLQLIGAPIPIYSRPGALLLFDRALRETEENLTDLLPEGYEVKIKEWDQ